MKKDLISAVALAAFGASSAFAQAVPAFGDNLTISLEAEVAAVCGAEVFVANGGLLGIDFGDLTAVPASDQVVINNGRIRYVCNVAAGFTRTISSENSGYLFRTGTSGGANNQIPWTFQHQSGNPDLRLTARQLTSPAINSISGSSVLLSGATGSEAGGNLIFRASGVAVPSAANASITTTNVFAGDYTDLVTIVITPN